MIEFETLRYILPPLIGALIGYCTNYIAVKMLFRPRTEKYLFGHKLPLTPGAIPKGKSRLAKACGEVVSNHLITVEDIEEKALAPEMKDAVTSKVSELLDNEIRDDLSLFIESDEDKDILVENISISVTDLILDKIKQVGISDIVVTEGGRIIKDKLYSSMIGLLIPGGMLDSLISSLGEEIDKYIDEKGYNLLKPHVDSVVNGVFDKSISELLETAGIDQDGMHEMIEAAYEQIIRSAVPAVLDKLNIAGIIEDKINSMDAEQLEELVLSVMKKELNTIVNLGALIGFVLGLINLVFII